VEYSNFVRLAALAGRKALCSGVLRFLGEEERVQDAGLKVVLYHIGAGETWFMCDLVVILRS
jgi:hypothetical protein